MGTWFYNLNYEKQIEKSNIILKNHQPIDMVLYLVASEALLEQGFMQLVMKLSIPQKKPKFLVVKEELTKQIKSADISKLCPQIRYECTVCFNSKTSAWLRLKMPSLTQRRLNHRLEIVIAIFRDVPRVSVVHHSVLTKFQANAFIL